MWVSKISGDLRPVSWCLLEVVQDSDIVTMELIAGSCVICHVVPVPTRNVGECPT